MTEDGLVGQCTAQYSVCLLSAHYDVDKLRYRSYVESVVLLHIPTTIKGLNPIMPAFLSVRTEVERHLVKTTSTVASVISRPSCASWTNCSTCLGNGLTANLQLKHHYTRRVVIGNVIQASGHAD